MWCDHSGNKRTIFKHCSLSEFSLSAPYACSAPPPPPPPTSPHLSPCVPTWILPQNLKGLYIWTGSWNRFSWRKQMKETTFSLNRTPGCITGWVTSLQQVFIFSPEKEGGRGWLRCVLFFLCFFFWGGGGGSVALSTALSKASNHQHPCWNWCKSCDGQSKSQNQMFTFYNHQPSQQLTLSSTIGNPHNSIVLALACLASTEPLPLWD